MHWIGLPNPAFNAAKYSTIYHPINYNTVTKINEGKNAILKTVRKKAVAALTTTVIIMGHKKFLLTTKIF